jgi:two-component system, chemotaxis family, response regulator Rcp1
VQPADQRSIQVFLAEDNRADVFLVELALQEHGIRFELLTVSDGEEAIRTVNGFGNGVPCPDIALIDQNLPKLDGDEVISILRAHPECHSVPIVVMSSSETHRELALAARFGAVYFRKPSSLPDFMKLGAVAKSLLANAN